jgi:hypothetical protein
MTKKVKIDYINNTDFYDALVEYKSKCVPGSPKPKVPEYIGECFMKIAENLAKRPNYFGYSFKDEMILDAIENMLLYCHNFDPKKSSNPFAYFTQIAWYAFLRRIAKEKKQQYIKYKSTELFGILDEEEINELNEIGNQQFQVYDNLYQFIEEYEGALLKKKQAVIKSSGLELFFDNEDIDDTVQDLIGDGDE